MSEKSGTSSQYSRMLAAGQGRDNRVDSTGRGRSGSVSPGLLTARKIITALWLLATTVQLVIWVVVCIVNFSFTYPFWLWVAVIGGAIVGGLWLVTESGRRSQRQA